MSMTPLQTKREPWTHQSLGYEYAMSNQGVGLFMGVGAGKTKVTVDTIANKGYNRVLIITLKNVIDDGIWEREFDRSSFIPFNVLPLNKGNTLDKMAAIRENYNTPRTVFELTYQTAIRPEMRELLYKGSWDAVILDEGQMIKSANSSMNKTMCTLGRRARQRFLLTGTPMPNGAIDVYGIFKFIDPSVFGTRKQDFESRYCVFGGFNGTQIVGYKNLEELHEKVAKHSYYVRTRDVLDLPPEMDLYRVAYLEPEVSKLYKTLKKESTVELDANRTITASNSLVLGTRLAQITGGFVTLDDGSVMNISNAKANTYIEVLESVLELGHTPKMVTFCRFTEEIRRVKEVASKYGTVGELSGQRSDFKAWKEGKFSHLVVQIDAGNAGIDLTDASLAVFFSKSFSLGQFEQARGRFVRPGQLHPVTFIHIQASGTIDRVVDKSLEEKSDMVRDLEAYIRSNL